MDRQRWLIKASMDETVCVLLLLTDFCVPSASSSDLYFVEREMTWDKAHDYCISEYTGMAKINDVETVNTMMSTPTGEYKHKAWIGLYKNLSEWTWVDGQAATYSNWRLGQPDNVNASELCVSLTKDGSWMDYSCSEQKPAVCFTDGVTADSKTGYFIVETLMTWTEAKAYCEKQGSILATVPDETANNNIQEKLDKESEKVIKVSEGEESEEDDDTEEAWIGLSRHYLWYWSDTGESSSFLNWQLGQPDNLSGEESCTAAALKGGTWTDEDCNATYPFFCYRTATSSLKTVVRMEIQSSADMEDAYGASLLLEQVHAAFVKRGLSDLTLTWIKPPVEQTKRNQFRLDAFLPCESNLQEDEP